MPITLTTPYIVAIGGSQVEDDTVGACVSMAMDYLGRMMTYVFKIGTLTGNPQNLNVGPYAQTIGQTVTVAVYVGPNVSGGNQTGQWWLNGVLQGSLVPSATLAPIIAQLLTNRNTAEGFVAVAGGLMPGATVAWAAL